MTYTLPDFTEILNQFIIALPSAAAIVVGALILRFLLNRGLTLLADRTRLTPGDVAPVRKVIGWLILAGTAILLLGAFNVPLGGLWAVLTTALGLVAIGFVAVWSVLSNISCTVMILFFRPFAVGDDIELAGEPVKGRVTDLNFLFTTLDSGDGELVQIPNNLFFQRVLRRRRSTSGEVTTLAEQLQRTEPAQVGS